MMQIVSHNMDAMNAERNLQLMTDRKCKSSEKMASGFKVNRAADDAAALTISEKMRGQIRGLNRGTQNTQDGISLIQTAEGATNEIQDMLQRMRELAVQSANDTNTVDERKTLNDEVTQLKKEINRISSSTTFNGRTVLQATQAVQIDADDYSNIAMTDRVHISTTNRDCWGKEIDFAGVNDRTKSTLIGQEFEVTCSQNCSQIFKFKFTDATSSNASIVGTNLTLDIGVNSDTIKNGDDVVRTIMDLVKANQTQLQGNGTDIKIGHANGLDIQGSKLIMYAIGKSMSQPPTYSPGMGQVHADKMMTLSEDIHFQISYEPYQEVTYRIQTLNTSTLGIGGVDLTTHKASEEAIGTIQSAIDEVSSYRSYMGSMQNRLEHIVDVNNNTSENTQAAESGLRDTDMASEVQRFSVSDILEQVGQVILAHANTNRESVLALLGM